MMNKEIQALPTIKQMGLSIATESFIWSIIDDDATTRIIAAHIKEKDDKIVQLKAQRDQAVEALEDIISVPREGQNRTHAAQVQMIMVIACAAIVAIEAGLVELEEERG